MLYAIIILFYILPVAVAAWASHHARHEPSFIHFAIWIPVPVVMVLGPLLFAIVAYQVFGIDLID